jgi:ATP-dependent Clp protease ATP-binding subunit ClpA
MGVLDAAQDVRTIKRLLERAEALALGSGDGVPGPEHLLLSALELDDGSAGRVLGRFGVDETALRTAIEEVHARALGSVGVEPGDPIESGASATGSGLFRSTASAQQVFQEAVSLSKQKKPSRLAGAHVVAATCSLTHGTVVRALEHLGVARDELRVAALAEVA